MTILINNTTLNVNNAYAERDTQNGIITLFVIVPYSEMDYADLKALCKANTEDIVKTTDDGTQEIFSGFSYASILDDEVNEAYTVRLTSDEYSFQLGRNRQLEADKANLESTVSAKENEISNLNVTVAEKDKAIEEKDATIEAKDTVIGEKEETIIELQAEIIIKDEELNAKNAEIVELLTIAEEYADMVFASLEGEEIEFPEAELEDLVIEESEVM